MKQQYSIGLLEEPDFTSPGMNGGGPLQISGISSGGPDQPPVLGKFNNTVVIKKGQLNQSLKNSMVLQASGNQSLAISSSGAPSGPNSTGSNNNSAHKDLSPTRGNINAQNTVVPRRNSRNINRNQPAGGVVNASNGGVMKPDQYGFVQSPPHHMISGPETAGDEQIIGGGGGMKVGSGVSLEHFQFLNQTTTSGISGGPQQIHLMNQTIRSPQQPNFAAVMNNIKNNGSLRNLQNFRSKRMEKVQQAQMQVTNQHLQFMGSGGGGGSNESSQVRAPPIQNGLYFSNIIQQANGPQSQRYHQPGNNVILGTTNPLQQTIGPGNPAMMMVSPRQQSKSKMKRASNEMSVVPAPAGGHQKNAQSMGEVTGIIKNIIANQTTTQMPNIASPRNNPIAVGGGGVGPNGVVSGVGGTGVSIERINKNISDSINQNKAAGGPHNKEIQLIQAYQHQKWKEQITQRKNKNVALRSLDTTYQDLASAVSGPNGSSYVLNTSREPSTKPQQHIQGIGANGAINASLAGLGATQASGAQKAGANGARQRIIQGNNPSGTVVGGGAPNGSLTSRFPQGSGQQQPIQYSPDAGVYSYQDQANYSQTIEDEQRMLKTQIKFPMSSGEAFKILQPLLWEVEKTEVLEFETVYFFNVVERKKQNSEQRRTQTSSGNNSGMMMMGSDNPKLINYGFDNENQEYNVIMHEHLAFRYEVVKKLGKGSFGIVLRVFDHKTKEFVALKILKNKKRLYKQGLVEAKLIETLNKADPEDKKNIIRKLDQFVFRKHLMITFEMLSINLYEFIKMNNFQGFSLNLIKRFAIQILIALFFMKEHNIVHCDMKPENILLRKINKSGIKIIDFGSGCFENEKIYTYIQSRFYRAPEIVLGIPYTTAIDMWSYGCILYELFVGYPLFPGEDEKEHMAMIMEVKGVPPRSVLARATRRKVFFDDDYQPILVPNSRGKIRNPNTKSLAALMNCQDRDFVDFVDKCIEWKVENRLTPEQAFSHPFIAKAVQELKGIRGQSESHQKVSSSGSNSQQQPAHPQVIQAAGNPNQQQQKELISGGAALISNSETLLPQINYKQ